MRKCRFILLISLLITSFTSLHAQVNVNVQVRSPFTPFIADYTTPAKLNDLHVSVLNTTSSVVRIKFRFSLNNISKGISLSIKESSNPLRPYVLNPNEFRFIQLNDVSQLYGKITYTDFNVSGIDIQRAIADGTIPDGVYEFCIQAFDYDAPGFSRPLSGSSPQGCAIFEVVYPDPPADVRINNNILNYSYGGNVPQVSRIGSNVQLYQVNFTPPVPSAGSQYQYELFLYEEQSINPRLMSESQARSALEVLPPYIRKTSMASVFIIDQSDLPLEENKNYYLFIRVKDLNNKTIFKNGGISSIQAFQLQNISTTVVTPPVISSTVCGKQLVDVTKDIRFSWEFSPLLSLGSQFWEHVSFQIKILRFTPAVTAPVDLFKTQTGILVKDTILRFSAISAATGNLNYVLRGLNASDPEIYEKKYVVAVRVVPDAPFKNLYSFVNEGRSAQCTFISGFAAPQQLNPLQLPRITYEVNYPLQDDTLPFMYVPVVVDMSPLHPASEIVLTKFSSPDEPFTNQLSYQAYVQKPGASSVNRLQKLLYPGILQTIVKGALSGDPGDFPKSMNNLRDFLPVAMQLMQNTPSNRLILGGPVTYKLLQGNHAVKFLGDAATTGVSTEMSSRESISWSPYSQPQQHRSDITWSLKAGTYSKAVKDTISIERYLHALSMDRLKSDFSNHDLIAKGYTELSGRYTLGMKKPVLNTLATKPQSPGLIPFSFTPSTLPRKMLPTSMGGQEWKGRDSFTVAQQWNLEVSRNASFTELVHVKSKIVYGTYKLPDEQGKLIRDLYSSVSIPLELQQTGKYYWRVTWSNISADAIYKNPRDFVSVERFSHQDLLNVLNTPVSQTDEQNKEAFMQYYRYWLNMEAEAALLGEAGNPGFVNGFGKRQAYLSSEMDSFEVKIDKNDPIQRNGVELAIAYPLDGDTLPFQYPPLILSYQSTDTNIVALITQMDGDLEVAASNRIIFRKPSETYVAQARDLSLNDVYGRIRSLLDQCAEAAFNGNNNPTECRQALDLMKNAKSLVGTDFLETNSPLIPLGHDLDHKLQLVKSLLDFNAESAILGLEYYQIPKVAALIYALPYKHNLSFQVKARAFSGSQNTTETERLDSAASRFWSGRSRPSDQIALNGSYHVGMKQPVLKPKNGQKILPGAVELKFKPSTEPAKLFPDLQGLGETQSFKWLSIAQQYNLEIARDPGFTQMVKVISRPVLRTYQLPIDIAKIRNDLYSEVSESIDLSEIGTYYWRVTWSNITIDINNASAAEKEYFRRTADLIADAALLGEQSAAVFTNPFELFTKRINYSYSAIDSFVIARDIVSFTLNYPLEGDTIPFMYPPVVLNRSSANNKGEVALFTSFHSDLEPLPSNRYFIIQQQNQLTDQIRAFQFDQSYAEVSALLRASADATLQGNDALGKSKREEALSLFRSKAPNYSNQIVDQFSGLLPLGNNSREKRALAELSLQVNGEAALLGMDFLLPMPNLLKMTYLLPYKDDVRWIARSGLYFEHSPDDIPLTDYLSAFQNGELTRLYGQTELVKNAFTSMNGSFNVGMKTPQLAAYGGQSLPPGEIQLKFTPSARPNKLLPDGMNAQNEWSEFLHLNIAQQLNIEVSSDRHFKTLDTVIQIPLVKDYVVPRDRDLIEQDLYTQRTVPLTMDQAGTYFWRATWSNIVNGNALTPEAEASLREMLDLFADDALLGGETPGNLMEIIGKRTNYRISSTDSFKVEMPVTRTESDCGKDCEISISNKQSIRHTDLGKGSIIQVGKFDMKLDSIVFNNGNLASGAGTIAVPYLNAPVRVKFSNLGINAVRRVVSGEVRAINYDKSFVRQFVSQEAQTNLWDAIYKEIEAKSGSDAGLMALSDALNESGNLVQGLFTDQPVSLPLGISTVVGNQRYTMSLTDLVFKPTKASANLITLLPVPFSNEVIGFGAQDLCINPEGFANLNNGGTLRCIKDVEIPMGEGMKLTIKGSSLENGKPACELKWNCDGFQHFQLAASFTIPNSILQKVENGVKQNTPVVADIAGQIRSLEDWMLGLNLEGNFELPYLPGYTMRFQNVTFDWSDTSNAETFAFPEGYTPFNNVKQWRGMHAGRISIRLPKELGGRQESERFEFNVQNVLIDQTGLSGKLEALNIFSLENGNFAGWKSSMDSISIRVVQNTLRNSRIAGRFQVPVMDRPMPYFATLGVNGENLTYDFGVRPEGSYNMPFLAASVNLTEGSVVSLSYVKDTFIIAGRFNGDIGFGDGSIGGIQDVQFGRLPFEGFTVRSKTFGTNSTPTLDINLEKLGGVELNNSIFEEKKPIERQAGNTLPEFGGFPLTIQNFKWDTPRNIAFPTEQGRNSDPKFGIKIKAVLNLSSFTPAEQDQKDENGYGIAGSVGVGIYGIARIDPTSGFQVHFAGVDVDTIAFKAKLSGVVEVDGKIALFNNDNTFGSGFSGAVEAKFVPGIGVGLVAMFGEKSGFRYWMVDGKLDFPAAPISMDFGLAGGAGPLYCIGVNGGAWHHMRREQGEAQAGQGLGRSNSGGVFFPDNATAFGLELGLTVQGPPGSSIYGNVNLRGEMNNNASVRTLGMGGSLWMLEEDKNKAPVFLNGNIAIDLNRKKFTASLRANINITNTIKGVKDTTIDGTTYYKAGFCILDVELNGEKTKWYLHAGNPGQPMGVTLTPPDFKSGISITNYMMTGNHNFIPPKYSDALQRIFAENGKTIPASPRVSQGNFAVYMGAGLTLPSIADSIGPFYYLVRGELGFDGSLNQDVPACGSLNGISGWYVTTRGYMAVQANAGIRIDAPFYKGRIAFAALNTAGIVTAGFANPLQVSGDFSMNYSVLGGLIYGVFNADFKYSEPKNCPINHQKGVFAIGSIVADVFPKNDAIEVLIGSRPTVLLNYPINKPFEAHVPREDDPEKIDTLRFVLKYKMPRMSRRQGSRDVAVSHTLRLSDDQLELEFLPDSFLKPGLRHQVTAEFTMYELRKGQQVKIADTLLNVSFTPEMDPSTIRPEDIAYTKPIIGQNYYIPQGSARLVFHSEPSVYFNKGNVFAGPDHPSGNRRLGDQYKYYLELFNLDSRAITEIPFTLSGNELRYTMPATAPRTLYMLRLVREELEYKKPKPDPRSQLENSPVQIEWDRNVPILMDNTYLTPGSGNNQAEYNFSIRQRDKAVTENVDRRIIMFSYTFKTSIFSSVQEKMNQLVLKESSVPFERNQEIQLTMESDEAFDWADLTTFEDIRNNIYEPDFHFSVTPKDASAWHLGEYRNKIHVPDSILMRLFGQQPVLPVYHEQFTDKEYRLSAQITGLEGPMRQIPASYDYRLITRIAPSVSQTLAQSITIIPEVMGSRIQSGTPIRFNAFGQEFSGTMSGSSSGSSAPRPASPQKKQLQLIFREMILAEQQFERMRNNYDLVFFNPNRDFTRYNRLTPTERNRIENAQNWGRPTYNPPGIPDVFSIGISSSKPCFTEARIVSSKTLPPNCRTFSFRGQGTIQSTQVIPNFSSAQSSYKPKK